MVERATPANAFPVPLVLDGGQRIVTSHLETVLGWTGGKSEEAPQALTLADSVLHASPTSRIVYACNLPASPGEGRTAALDSGGQLPNCIGRDLEENFVAGSFPGGQTAIIASDGERTAIQLRWVCITAHFSIGAVWRCFARLRARADGGLWRAIEHDYIFESGGGAVLNPPGEVRIPFDGEARLDVKLSHPEGMLTCFPCESGRVKVTRLSPNGWAKRELISLMLHADDSIAALFSDGTLETIAVTAPLPRQAARAA